MTREILGDGDFLAEAMFKEAIDPYKLLRELLPFVGHTKDCAYLKWAVAEHIQKSYGTGYSAGPEAACTCGARELMAKVRAQIG